MKTNFIKKLSLFVLGGVMALGVGVGLSSSKGVGEVKAETKTIVLNNLGSTLSTTYNTSVQTVNITDTDTTDVYTLNYLQGKKQDNSILLAKSLGAFISNKTKIPGSIKSVTVYINSGASGKTTYHCAFSTTECTSEYTTGSTAINITGGNSHKYTCSVANANYFCISLGNANNGQVLKLEIEYEYKSKTLTSLSISGEMQKKNYYVGDDWDTNGLNVTAHYSDSDDEDVTSKVKWTPTPLKPELGCTSLKLIASLNAIDSPEKIISGITVSQPLVAQYKLVTSVNDLVAGCNYAIGNGTSGDSKFISTEENSNNRKTSIFTVTDSKITANENLLVLELGGSSGAWTFLTTNYGGNDGYLNATDTTNNNYLKIVSTDNQYNKFSISFNNSAAVITCTGKNSRNIIRANGDIISCYTSGQSAVYLYKEISTEPSFAVSPKNITAHLYGENAEAELITSNITSPSFEIDSYTVADIVDASISENKIVVSPKAEGTTVITINETTSKLSAELTVTVDRIPVSIEMFDNEVQTTHYIYKSTLLKVYDANHDSIDIKKCEIAWSSSDTAIATIGDNSVTGIKQGDATISVSVTVPDGESLTDSCVLSVLDEYPISSPDNYVSGTLATSTYDAGDQFNPSGITVFAKGHFSKELEEFSDLSIFTYTTSSEGVGKAKTYYFTSDDVGSNKTIYIYYNDDQIASVSGITVNVKEIPLTSISFEEGEDADIIRDESITLTPVFEPNNTTDARTLNWKLEQDSSGISLEEVNGKGVVTVARNAVVGNVGTVTATSTVHDDVSASFKITVIREEQKVHIKKISPESWDKVEEMSELDETKQYVIVCENKKVELTGFSTTSTIYGTFDSYTDKLSGKLKFNIEKVEGTENKFLFTHTDNDGNISYLKCSEPTTKANDLKLDSTGTQFEVSFDTNGNINMEYVGYDSGNVDKRVAMNIQSNQERFAGYKQSTLDSSTDGYAKEKYARIQLYKLSGGTTEKDLIVSDNLYNAVLTAESYFECSSSGIISFKDDKKWSSVEAVFSDILSSGTQIEKDILRYGLSVDQHDKEGKETGLGNEVEHFLSRYDYIVGKYGKSTYSDFLERNPEAPAGGVNPLITLSNIQDTTWIIVIVGLVSLTAVGGYLFIRKRKED